MPMEIETTIDHNGELSKSKVNGHIYEPGKFVVTQKTKPETKAAVDVVMADGNTVASDRCLICGKAFKKNDAIIRTIVSTPYVTLVQHRRCTESLLDDSVEDLDVAEGKLAAYRRVLIDQKGYEPLDRNG